MGFSHLPVSIVTRTLLLAIKQVFNSLHGSIVGMETIVGSWTGTTVCVFADVTDFTVPCEELY